MLVPFSGFEHHPAQFGRDPHVGLFEQPQVLFEAPGSESQAVQPEQHTQSTGQPQPYPPGVVPSPPVIENNQRGEVQRERDGFLLAPTFDHLTLDPSLAFGRGRPLLEPCLRR